MLTYTWYQWFAFFYFYCFFGWVFESTYVSAKQGRFVNRGFLRIPMLPLYGSGAVMMLWVSLPFRNSLILTYISGVIGATLLEYITGYVMELLFKVRYWDYSHYKYNLHGYICLTSSIAWGFLTILMTEVIDKPVAKFVTGLSPAVCTAMAVGISCVFFYDVVYSVRKAFALGKALETLTKLRNELESMQVQAALLKMEAIDRLEMTKAGLLDRSLEKRDVLLEHRRERRGERLELFENLTGINLEEFCEKAGLKLHIEDLTELKDLAGLHLERFKGKTEQQLMELKAETENRIASIRSAKSRSFKSLLKSNPTAASSKFSRALEELKDYLGAE